MAYTKIYIINIIMQFLLLIVIMFLLWSPVKSLGPRGSAAKRQKREQEKAAREAATHKINKQSIEACASTSGSDANNCELPPISAKPEKIKISDVPSLGWNIVLGGIFSLFLFSIFCII